QVNSQQDDVRPCNRLNDHVSNCDFVSHVYVLSLLERYGPQSRTRCLQGGTWDSRSTFAVESGAKHCAVSLPSRILPAKAGTPYAVRSVGHETSGLVAGPFHNLMAGVAGTDPQNTRRPWLTAPRPSCRSSPSLTKRC